MIWRRFAPSSGGVTSGTGAMGNFDGYWQTFAEWSMDRGQYGWGDLPSFVQMMFNFFKDNADILAFENNFNNGGSGDWNFYPESSANMNSAELYKQLWKQ